MQDWEANYLVAASGRARKNKPPFDPVGKVAFGRSGDDDAFCSTTRLHPRELKGSDVEAFLTHLAVDRNVSASTQAQAISALLFLYGEVLEVEFPWLDRVVSAKVPQRLPVVLTEDEVRRLMTAMRGPLS